MSGCCRPAGEAHSGRVGRLDLVVVDELSLFTATYGTPAEQKELPAAAGHRVPQTSSLHASGRLGAAALRI